jgi:hypothetical protein
MMLPVIRRTEPARRRPLSVSGLRVAAIAGPRLVDALDGECELLPLDTHPVPEWPEGSRPDLLLIDGDGLPSQEDSIAVDAIGALLETCREAGVPTGAWVGEDRVQHTSPLLSRVHRVFAPDTVVAASLADRVPQRPIVVPHAASKSSLRGELPTGAGVAYSDGYDGCPPEGSEAYVESLLEAAAPFGLQPLPADDPERAAETLRECAALLHIGSAESLPRAAFDALGAGLHVVAPGNHLGLRVVPGLVAHGRAAEKVEAELRSAMGSAEEEVGRRQLRRAAAGHAHTYPHRIATIASALGFALLPAGEAARLA